MHVCLILNIDINGLRCFASLSSILTSNYKSRHESWVMVCVTLFGPGFYFTVYVSRIPPKISAIVNPNLYGVF